MTIRKGETWGEPAGDERPGEFVSTDSELAALLQGYRNSQTVAPLIGLLGGSLHRTLGARFKSSRNAAFIAMTVRPFQSLDLGSVSASR